MFNVVQGNRIYNHMKKEKKEVVRMKKVINYLLAGLAVLFMVFGFTNNIAQAEGLTVEEIQEKGVLTIATSADYPPYEFHAMIDGEDRIVGLDIAFAQYIADDLGVELEIEDLGFDVLLASLESRTTDMVIAGLTYTEEREASVDFSDDYFVDGPAFVIRSDDAETFQSKEDLDVEENVIGVQTGSTEELKVDQLQNAEIYRLNDIAQLIIALKTGRVDAVLMTETTALSYAENDEALASFTTNLQEVEGASDGKAVAVPNNSPEFINYLNGVIEEVNAQGLFDQWLDEAIGLSGSQPAEGEAAVVETEEESLISRYWPYFYEGLKTTLIISLVSVFFGFILGFLLAVMRLSSNPILRGIGTAYVEFVRGTPMLIQVTFMYFGLGLIIDVSALVTGIIAVSLNSGAYVCEIIRSGLSSVPAGQTEAARSLGLNSTQTMRKVIFPQALRNIWPALGNEFVTIIKESSIVSTIGVAELTFQTNVVQSMSYRGLLPLFIAMCMYFILTFTLTKLLNYFEGRMNYE